jgi:hypothetical protein
VVVHAEYHFRGPIEATLNVGVYCACGLIDMDTL